MTMSDVHLRTTMYMSSVKCSEQVWAGYHTVVHVQFVGALYSAVASKAEGKGRLTLSQFFCY